MEVVSRTHLLRVLAALLLAGAFVFSGRIAAAGAASIEDLLAGALAPSAPALLGPITSTGRVGWACTPEKAASAAGWHEAELPHDSGTR
jgi:hypothetical protein